MSLNTKELDEQIEKSARAGMDANTAELTAKRDRICRNAMAYEHFRVVTQGHVDRFNARLRDLTIARGRVGHNGINAPMDQYDQLVFKPIAEFAGNPPADVLDRVAEVRGMGIFDTMEVAKIESVLEYKDPIVFGRIEGCPDRFYLAQWDNDVNINDLLGPNEG